MKAIAIVAVAMVVGLICLPLRAQDAPPAPIQLGLVIQVNGDGNSVVVADTRDANGAATIRPVAAASDRPFMGIHVSPVPAAVASQLQLKDRGIMVGNIVKGSPAEKAGLDRYDVIVAIGDDKSGSVKDVDEFIGSLGRRKTGDVLHLTVIRAGKERTVDVTLAHRPAGLPKYVYEENPDDRVSDETRLLSGLLRKQGGDWILEGPSGMSIDVSAKILGAMPEGLLGKVMVQSQVIGDPNGQQDIFLTTVTNGRTLSFKRMVNGKIEVTRTGPDRKSRTETYDNADQLKQKDKEAYEFYECATTGNEIKLVPGLRMAIRGYLLPEAGAGVDAAAAKQFEKELEAQLAKLAEQAQPNIRNMRPRPVDTVAPVSRKFDVDEKGRIRVTIVKDGSELNLTFADEAELKQKNPGLYAEYKKLQNPGEIAK